MSASRSASGSTPEESTGPAVPGARRYAGEPAGSPAGATATSSGSGGPAVTSAGCTFSAIQSARAGPDTLARRWCRSAAREIRSASRQGRSWSGVATQMVSTPGRAGRTGVALVLPVPGSWSTPPDYGCGVLTTLQLVPFQASASVSSLPMPAKSPTAMQLDGLVHATPRSSLADEPGSGVLITLQPVPFQASARLNEDSPVGSVHEPTPMHAAAAGQETPPKLATPKPRGFGLVSSFHPVPFHCSARVTSKMFGVSCAPTAMHAAADAQATPPNPALRPGAGVGRICHAAPFHCSARVSEAPVPLLKLENPAAVQALGLVQDTVLSAVPPGVRGVPTTVHAVPFHRSARVNMVSFCGVPTLPTAMQSDPLVHETPFRVAPVWAILGVGTTCHLVPFQDSANGCWMVTPGGTSTWVWPTAMQLVLLAHDTELSSSPPPGWRGAGAGRTVQVLPFQCSASGKF